MKTKAFLALTLALLLTSAAYADIHVRDYKGAKAAGGATWDQMKVFIAGSGTALGYANVELVRTNRLPLYCSPDSLRIRSDNFLDIIDTEMASHQSLVTDDTYIEEVLIAGLMSTFPCKAK